MMNVYIYRQRYSALSSSGDIDLSHLEKIKKEDTVKIAKDIPQTQ